MINFITRQLSPEMYLLFQLELYLLIFELTSPTGISNPRRPAGVLLSKKKNLCLQITSRLKSRLLKIKAYAYV